MAKITGDLIVAQTAAAGRRPLSEERAAALAEAVGLMVRAADEAATGLTLGTEPAHFLTVMDETAAR